MLHTCHFVKWLVNGKFHFLLLDFQATKDENKATTATAAGKNDMQVTSWRSLNTSIFLNHFLDQCHHQNERSHSLSTAEAVAITVAVCGVVGCFIVGLLLALGFRCRRRVGKANDADSYVTRSINHPNIINKDQHNNGQSKKKHSSTDNDGQSSATESNKAPSNTNNGTQDSKT